MTEIRIRLVSSFLVCIAYCISTYAQNNQQKVEDEPLRILVYLEVSSKDNGLHDRVASAMRNELRKFADVEILDKETFDRVSVDSTARKQRYPNHLGPFQLSVLPLEVPCGNVMSVICTRPSDPSVVSSSAYYEVIDTLPQTDKEQRKQELNKYRIALTNFFQVEEEFKERIEHHFVTVNGSNDVQEICKDVVASIDEEVLERWRQIRRNTIEHINEMRKDRRAPRE